MVALYLIILIKTGGPFSCEWSQFTTGKYYEGGSMLSTEIFNLFIYSAVCTLWATFHAVCNSSKP